MLSLVLEVLHAMTGPGVELSAVRGMVSVPVASRLVGQGWWLG